MAWEFFTDDELKCKCGNCDGGQMDNDFMELLVDLRGVMGFPFMVTSAFRCHDHNNAVGGSSGSMHLQGRAVDIALSGENAYAVIQSAWGFGFKGLGISQSAKGHFIHLDNRDTFAMWTY